MAYGTPPGRMEYEADCGWLSHLLLAKNDTEDTQEALHQVAYFAAVRFLTMEGKGVPDPPPPVSGSSGGPGSATWAQRPN